MAESPAAGKKTHIAAIKILAIFLVIFNHTGESGYMLFAVAKDSPLFPLYLFLSILCKIAVPLFFMCSGALLLGREETIKDLLLKRILRYVFVILIFSLAQYAFAICQNIEKFSLEYFLRTVYSSRIRESYWFLYSYLAILFMLPLLRKFAKVLDGRTVIYFIALEILFLGIVPSFEYLFNHGAFRINLSILLIQDNIFYVIMGYWFENALDVRKLTSRQMAAGSLAALMMIALAFVLTVYKGHVDGEYSAEISQMFHARFIAIPAIATYILIKRFFINRKMSDAFVERLVYLSALTFGIYLVHSIIMTLLKPLYDALFPTLRSLPSTLIWVVCIMIASGALTVILKRVPPFSKLI
jgi:surface polysaccharide O-acyltransferase-like enzyme